MSDLNKIDEMYMNYIDSLETDSVLTKDGYILNKKKGFIDHAKEYTTNTLDTYKQWGETGLKYNKEIGTGILRGGAKLTEGAGSLALAGLEKLNLISDGSVERFGKWYEKEVYPRIGEVDTLAGGLAEGFTQFATPGVGYYKLFGNLMKVHKTASTIKKFVNRAKRLTVAEVATVGTAQVAGDPNFATLLTDMFGVDKKIADGMTKDILVYLATPETSKDANAVLEEKIKSSIADTPVAYLAEGLLAFAGVMKGFVKKPKMIDEIEQSFDIIDNQFPKAQKFETESLVDFIKLNPDGFTVSIDGLPTPKKGFVLAPIKETELIFDAKTISYEDVVKLKDNVKFLIKSYNDMGVENMRVYAGGWLNKKTNKYVLDASVIIDNKADALYIANAGKQDAIFDLGEFNEISTKTGIEELQQSGAYRIDTSNVRQSDNVKLVEGFEKARLASEGGTN